jgi:hypothetical protein
MKHFILLFVVTLLPAAAFAQFSPLEGSWRLENVQINLLEKGMSLLVHTLNDQEINEAAIPTTLTFADKVMAILPNGEKQLDYSFGNNILSLLLSADKLYSGWMENETSLVLVSDYKDPTSNTSEIRIVYKKVYREQ